MRSAESILDQLNVVEIEMNETKLNFIAGDWMAGESEIENRNPSDLSDLVGSFAQASTDQLETTLDRAHPAQIEWAAYGPERKQAVLMNIGNELIARAKELGSLARATHFRRNAQTGVVMVNLPTAGTDYHGPREQGEATAEFYTTVKTAYISAGASV